MLIQPLSIVLCHLTDHFTGQFLQVKKSAAEFNWNCVTWSYSTYFKTNYLLVRSFATANFLLFRKLRWICTNCTVFFFVRTLKKDKYWHTVKRFCNLRLEKKQKINSWKRHALYVAGLSYARNRWEFERVVRNSMGKETWSIYIAKYSDIWKFYPSDYLNLLTPWVPFVVFGVLCRL